MYTFLLFRKAKCRNCSFITRIVHVTFMAVILCFVDRASRYIRVKKNQLDANLFSVYFVRTLHVSGVTTAHHQEAQRKPTTVGRLTVCLLMIGCGYARNM